MLILICDAFDPGLPAKLARFGEVTDDMARLGEADVALIRSKTKATAEWFAGAPKLKLIIRGGVGTDNIDKVAAKERGVRVHNTPKASGIAVAELAFAMMIAVPNHLVKAHTSMVAGEFLKKELKRTELFGKTLGTVGIGNIAQELAKRAAAFGMNVCFYDPYVDACGGYTKVDDLKDLFARCDYVSMHLPLTPETENTVNADVLAGARNGLVVVNTGRGKTVDPKAMVAALQSGKVACYATDVWQKRPAAGRRPVAEGAQHAHGAAYRREHQGEPPAHRPGSGADHRRVREGGLTMARIFNFSAGPSTLPLPVLEQIQRDMVDYKGTGMSLIEASHRGPAYSEVRRPPARACASCSACPTTTGSCGCRAAPRCSSG
ncbi:MAG: NAD(P)-dependent oxidoreductase [Candidatus Krumholzibacteriia bacterium]